MNTYTIALRNEASRELFLGSNLFNQCVKYSKHFQNNVSVRKFPTKYGNELPNKGIENRFFFFFFFSGLC